MSENCNLEKQLCRCCHSDGSFRNITSTYYNQNNREVYSDMLRECFDIELVPVNEDLRKSLCSICDMCIQQLRDASSFKKQVLACEKSFLNLIGSETTLGTIVKMEPEDTDEDNSTVLLDYLSNSDKCQDPYKVITHKPRTKSPDMIEQVKQNQTILRGRRKNYIESFKRSTSDVLTYSHISKVPADESLVPKEDSDEPKEDTVNPKVKDRFADADDDGLPEFKFDSDDEPLHKKSRAKEKKSPKKTKPPKKKTKKKAGQEIGEAKAELEERGEDKGEQTEKGDSEGDGEMIAGCIKVIKKPLFRPVEGIDYKTIGDIYQCCNCDKKGKYDTIRKHIKKIHYKISDFLCPHCQARFATMTTFIRHKLEAHNIDDRFSCGACDKVFMTKVQLKKHINSYHMLGEKYKCDHCEYETFSNEGLYKHKFKHRTVKEFHCSYCTKSFLRKTTLQLHEKIHTGDRTKVCKLCGQAFVQKASLNYHMSKYHPGCTF